MDKKITREMKIGEIFETFPTEAKELAEIMTGAGLHCVGCGAATFETLEQGAMGHGMDSSKVDELVDRLNQVIIKTDNSTEDGPIITLTADAVTKIKEIMSSENATDGGLRIAAMPGGCAGVMYDMSLQPSPAAGDQLVEQDGIKIFIDGNSIPHLKGVEINFVNSERGSGFAFNNPNVQSGCGSCGGGCS